MFCSNRFIALNDGSTDKQYLIVVDFRKFLDEDQSSEKIKTAFQFKITGEVVEVKEKVKILKSSQKNYNSW